MYCLSKYSRCKLESHWDRKIQMWTTLPYFNFSSSLCTSVRTYATSIYRSFNLVKPYVPQVSAVETSSTDLVTFVFEHYAPTKASISHYLSLSSCCSTHWNSFHSVCVIETSNLYVSNLIIGCDRCFNKSTNNYYTNSSSWRLPLSARQHRSRVTGSTFKWHWESWSPFSCYRQNDQFEQSSYQS